MLQILGFQAPGKANLPGTFGRHCLELVPTFRAGCFLKLTVGSSLLEFFSEGALLGVPKPGCFKPGCLRFLRGSALLRSLNLRLFALFFALFCTLLRYFALFCAHLHSHLRVSANDRV